MSNPANFKALKGGKTTAQGKAQRAAALGPPPPQNPSAEWAKQMPGGWTNAVIEDCLLAYENGRKIRQGWSPQCEGHPAESRDDWGVLKTSAIQDGLYVDAANKQLPEKLEPRAHLEVEIGDILITCAGPRSRCGVACLVRKTRPKLLISGKMYQLRADPETIDRGLLELFLREPGTQKRIDEMKTGISDSGLNLTHSRFATLEIPLPPLAEQRRIVAKIEELFSELDAGEESLRRARRQLGVYRQSLLKQAFEGKLTEQWRKQNLHLLESSEQLLKRIQAERQRRYLEELKLWEAAGGNGSKPKKPTAIAPFAPVDLVGDSVVPDAWIVMTYGDLCSLIRNGISQKPSGTAGHKIARISAVRPMVFDLQDYRFLDCDDEFASGYTLRAGDLVFTRYNGARRFVGVCARFASSEPRLYPDKLIRTCPDLPSLDSRFLEIALNTGLSRAWLETKIRTTAGQSGVSGGDVKAMPVPLCSLPEQREIVRLLDEQFTVIEQNEREIDAALKRSAALRQSILKKAFTGQLVPQDPTDEPASALLERIRAERAAIPSTPSRRTKARK